MRWCAVYQLRDDMALPALNISRATKNLLNDSDEYLHFQCGWCVSICKLHAATCWRKALTSFYFTERSFIKFSSLMCVKSWGLVTAAPSSFQTLSLLNNEFISNHPWFFLSLVRNVEEAWDRKKKILCADKLKTVCLAGLTEKINIYFFF